LYDGFGKFVFGISGQRYGAFDITWIVATIDVFAPINILLPLLKLSIISDQVRSSFEGSRGRKPLKKTLKYGVVWAWLMSILNRPNPRLYLVQ
jgi:hypothetical protein